MLKNWKISVLAAVILASCGPRDVAQEGRNGTAATGQPMSYSATGERSSTCPADFTDSVNVPSPVEFDSQVLSGKITASITAGDRNCFRIGSTAKIKNKDTDSRGEVIVTKVEIVAAENLSSVHASAMGMTVDEVKAFAKAELGKVTFQTKGMVNITYFKLKNGAAPGGTDTDTPVPTDDITTIDKTGDRPSSCPSDFTDSKRLVIAADLTDKVLSGTVKATMEPGAQNCFKIGSEVSLVNPGKGAPSIGAAKIVKVQIVPKDKVGKEQAAALGLDEKSAKALASDKVAAALAAGKFDPKDLVAITYFEVEGAAPPIPVIDVDVYKKQIPTFKEQLGKKLETVLATNGVEWDPSTLDVAFYTVTEAFQKDGETHRFPLLRITFTTKKGNKLTLFNVMDAKNKSLLMEAEFAKDDYTDIEGTIISSKTTWSSVDKTIVPTGMILYNLTTDKPTSIILGKDFDPLTIEIPEN